MKAFTDLSMAQYGGDGRRSRALRIDDADAACQ
jgi:hypothetical protein